jgi:hypothetical protein
LSLVQETAVIAPFEIWEVMLDHSTIKFFEPLVLTPEILPPEEPGDRTYLTVDVPELAISSHGIDIEELVSAIRCDIRFAWRHFVRAKDTKLTADAKKIKYNYLAIAEATDE